MIPRVFKTKTQEGMENQTKREKVKIVCLGDSIFQNNNYVGIGDSVEDILNQRLSESDSYALMLAEGNSLIKNVYPQIQNLEDRKDWGGKTDYVFLSVGISDILQDFKPLSKIHDNFIANTLSQYKKKEADKIFRKYLTLVNTIKEKFPNSKLVLSTIYYPVDSEYEKFHNVIKYWNQSVIDYAKMQKNKITNVLRIDNVVKNSQDFTHSVEPSGNGSRKIVSEIQKVSG